MRRIDPLGRITLPVEIRRELDLKFGDNVEFFVTENTIVLKKFNEGCCLCGSRENLFIHPTGKRICHNCATAKVRPIVKSAI